MSEIHRGQSSLRPGLPFFHYFQFCPSMQRRRPLQQPGAAFPPARRTGAMAMEVGTRARLAGCDFGISFIWAWSGALARLLAHGLGDRTAAGELVKAWLYVGSLFLSAWVGRTTGGGSGNPLSLLTRSVSDDFDDLTSIVFARIPAQVCGSIVGVASVTLILPVFTYSSPLKVGVVEGAVTEGLLAFGIASVLLALKRYDPKDFVVKTWIHAISRLVLRTLASDLTGGIMNPASVTKHGFLFTVS